MNSIIKVTDKVVVDVMIVRALHFDNDLLSIYFMRHDLPLDVECDESTYLDFYTKWRNHNQWRLNIALGEDE